MATSGHEQSNAAPVYTERRGQALWIFINREARRNAINPDVLAGIQAALTDLSGDVRAVILTGAGRKAFCAGADLARGTGVFGDELDEPTTDFGRLARIARELRVPMIARINGDCVAGGMGLMALADLAIVADHARFGLPEGKVGVFPMQVLVLMRRMLTQRHINQLCLTGELISATRAAEIGIANEVVPYEVLDARVNRLVEQTACLSPVALARGKYAMAAMDSMNFNDALAFAETQIAVVSRTDDAREGLAAFNEKRPPRWVKPAEPGQ